MSLYEAIPIRQEVLHIVVILFRVGKQHFVAGIQVQDFTVTKGLSESRLSLFCR